MTKLGKVVVNPSYKALPSGSFVLYYILSIITLGLFEFYWYYVLTKDFNEHFHGPMAIRRQFNVCFVKTDPVYSPLARWKRIDWMPNRPGPVKRFIMNVKLPKSPIDFPAGERQTR